MAVFDRCLNAIATVINILRLEVFIKIENLNSSIKKDLKYTGLKADAAIYY